MSDFMDLPKALAHLAARNAPCGTVKQGRRPMYQPFPLKEAIARAEKLAARTQGENRPKRSLNGILGSGMGILAAGEMPEQDTLSQSERMSQFWEGEL